MYWKQVNKDELTTSLEEHELYSEDNNYICSIYKVLTVYDEEIFRIWCPHITIINTDIEFETLEQAKQDCVSVITACAKSRKKKLEELISSLQ